MHVIVKVDTFTVQIPIHAFGEDPSCAAQTSDMEALAAKRTDECDEA